MRETLVIAGDTFPSKQIEAQYAGPELDALLDTRIREIFRNASFSVCNLEGALTDCSRPIEKLGPLLKASPSCVNFYKNLGVDCVMTANNHITDYGAEGWRDTIGILDSNGIGRIGTAQAQDDVCYDHLVTNISGKKICIYNVAETMFNTPFDADVATNLYDEYAVCNRIKELRTSCDYLAVIYHGGAEYHQYPTPENKKRFHRMADCGADLVVGQHTHCIGCEEYYNGSYLLYGQGNFHFARQTDELKRDGLVLEVIFDEEGFSVRKHKVRQEKSGFLGYPVDQDLSAMDNRSGKISDDEFLIKEYTRFARTRLFKLLHEFEKDDPLHLMLKKLLGHKLYCRLFGTRISHRQLLRILHVTRSEQVRELAQYILMDYISDGNGAKLEL